MTKVILTIFAIIVPAFLGFILAYQIYKKKNSHLYAIKKMNLYIGLNKRTLRRKTN